MPFPSGLYPQFFRALWDIKGKIYAGVSGRRILQYLRQPEINLGYRTQNYYRDQRRILEAKAVFEKVLQLSEDRRIPEYMHVQASNVLPKQYAYATRVSVMDYRLGISRDFHITVDSDERLTRREVMDRAVDRVSESPDEYEIEWARVEEDYRSL